MAATGWPHASETVNDLASVRIGTGGKSIDEFIHTDQVYARLFEASRVMEDRLRVSLENYKAHPDVQANLQQLQYDLQQWNLALTTMTNINKNLGDALNSIASNFR